MRTTFVEQDAAARSLRPRRLHRKIPVPTRRWKRNGAAAPVNGVAARNKASLATATEGNGNGNGNRALISALVNSKIYREYEQAFTNLTGLPVALQPVETWQLPHHGKSERKSVLRAGVRDEPRVRRLSAGAGTAL